MLAARAAQPNIVIIVADDLGFADVGFRGSDIRTPNLDRLAARGVVLERFYVAPMCSPTRAGLMTGRHPIRLGMARSVIPPHRDYGLDPEAETLPELLARAGYRHRACFGKWHLGHLRTEWHPLAQGFNHFVGCLNGAIDYFTHEREGERDFHRNHSPYQIDGYATDILAAEASAYIGAVPAGEPYFVYLPFNAPHSPFQAKPADLAKYPDRPAGRSRTYAAMVDSLDQGIGRVMEAIAARKDAENTLVLFFSDNGGVDGVGNNTPLRGAKLTPYEGGIRAAAIMHWPAGGIAGGGRFHGHIGYIDVMPTLQAAAGLNLSLAAPYDGVNALPALQGAAPLPARSWFTYFDQGAAKRERLALHRGHHKLVIERPAPDGNPQDPTSVQLFDLFTDPAETLNLVPFQPDLTSELKAELERFSLLRRDDQTPRYGDGRQGFVAPKDWQITPDASRSPRE
jgi:arylsulfatase A-like enzyme